MSVQLSILFESPRGPVTLTADLTGLKGFEVSEEVQQFFSAALSIRCRIWELKEEMQQIRESPVIPPVSECPRAEREMLVIS